MLMAGISQAGAMSSGVFLRHAGSTQPPTSLWRSPGRRHRVIGGTYSGLSRSRGCLARIYPDIDPSTPGRLAAFFPDPRFQLRATQHQGTWTVAGCTFATCDQVSSRMAKLVWRGRWGNRRHLRRRTEAVLTESAYRRWRVTWSGVMKGSRQWRRFQIGRAPVRIFH